MGVLDREAGEIHAKIVYWGSAGAGKTANAQVIHRKLKKDHRGELQVMKTASKPVARYELLPVELGSVRGLKTSIHLNTTPGGDAHEDERRTLLDGVDGVVFVADLRPDRHEATVASLEELKGHLGSYGRELEDLILVVQYNHRDEADENALDKLHRRLDVKPASQFECIASDGTGVLACLTAISKLILARIRQQADADELASATPEPAPQKAAPAQEELGSDDDDEVEIEIEMADVEDESAAGGFRLVTAGPAEIADGALRIPVRLIEESTGREIDLSLRLSLES